MPKKIKEDETLETEAASDEESQDTETEESDLESEETEEVETEETDEESEGDAEESEEDSTGEDILESELEKEKKRLGKKIDKERGKRIEAEKGKGISAEEVLKMIDEGIATSERRTNKSQAQAIAAQISGSDAERDLTLIYLESKIIPSGNIEQDVKDANALVNLKKNDAKTRELQKSIQSKKSRSGGSQAGAGTEQEKVSSSSKEEKEAADFAGTTVEKLRESRKKRE